MIFYSPAPSFAKSSRLSTRPLLLALFCVTASCASKGPQFESSAEAPQPQVTSAAEGARYDAYLVEASRAEQEQVLRNFFLAYATNNTELLKAQLATQLVLKSSRRTTSQKAEKAIEHLRAWRREGTTSDESLEADIQSWSLVSSPKKSRQLQVIVNASFKSAGLWSFNFDNNLPPRITDISLPEETQ